jgi:molybdenum cofactor cytidylyltransferase
MERHDLEGTRINVFGAIILAAGCSSRLGQPKLLLPLDGKSLIRSTVEQVSEAGGHEWKEIIVVLGHEAAAVQRDLAGLEVRCVFNPQFAFGMSTSLKAGVTAVSPEVDGVMIFLGDQPLVSTEVVRRLLTVFRESRPSIVVPSYGGVRGNPVLFSRSLFSELTTVEGDKGGREVVMRDPERVATVAFPQNLAPRDVDTWEDYETLRRLVESKEVAGN